jgi:hypothetical protein
MDFFHHNADPAAVLVAAFAATHVSRLTNTGYWRQRPLHYPENLTKRNTTRFPLQEVTPTLAFAALQNATVAEFEQDELQELVRDPLALSNVRDEHWPCPNSRASAIVAFNAYFDL